jgi:hypothetical protein
MLKVELDGMPEAKTSFIGDGWRAGTHKNIAEQWKSHSHALALILEGVRVAVLCHLELGERDAAMHAFEALLRDLDGLKMPLAAKRSRLAPYDPKDPPEAIWERGGQMIEQAKLHLDDYRAGTLCLEFPPEVLGYDENKEL